jgi:hypothetical protein
MSDKILPNRATEYRRQATKVYAKAKKATDDKVRAGFLQAADIWEQMATWEDKQLATPSKRLAEDQVEPPGA